MTEPTIARRLERRIILMTQDEGMIRQVRACLEPPWEVTVVTDLEDLGAWNEVLLYRFLLLDLDEVDAFDPLDVIRILRMEYQINLPVFCFGGDADIQDEMRLSRADRFFSREEMIQRLPEFMRQYDW
jgi:DNA-binding response OmpR family regulator